MKTDFRNIHIGHLIAERVEECNMDNVRICNFFSYSQEEVDEMYTKKNLCTELLLKWSKLLCYDFFRLYTQHLILYSPPERSGEKEVSVPTSLPLFRKHIYTKELISFVIEQINIGAMNKNEVITKYRIPKTTLYKWLSKYNSRIIA
ncbi:transposase [Chryseobacterium sp. CH21]|uniref:transposase n=1 Tax=Chryseobacterium sp. CH21 TaxID=713556 RepID=UPI00100B77D6|nr:transposase [Chryseobacterium sp. CH21]RXM41311.1 transposase [Chryseobacterium sp. CH21]